jgi:hypothetical protein
LIGLRLGDVRCAAVSGDTSEGEADGRVELLTANGACSGAVALAVGDRKGFLLFGEGPEYELNECTVTTAAQLAQAARPPRGRRSGIARLLVEGDLRGSSHLVALTGRGRRLGSVHGSEGEVVDSCPGGRFVVQAGERLHVIRMRDLKVTRRAGLPGDGAVDVRCLSPSGQRAVALTFEFNNTDGPEKPLRLVYVRAGMARTVARAEGGGFSLGARALAAARGGRVAAYDYETGRRTVALRLLHVTGVSWAPDGGTLAALASHADRSVLAVLRRDGEVSHRPVELAGPAFDAVTWVTANRIAVVEIRAATGPLFTADLRPAGRIAGWDSPGVAGNGAIWMLKGERIHRLSLDGSGAQQIGRRIAGARTVTVIPGGGRIDGTRRSRPTAARAAPGAAAPCAWKREVGSRA